MVIIKTIILLFNVQQHILTQSDAIFDAIILVDCKEMMEYGDCLHLHMQYIDRKTQGFTLSFKSGNNLTPVKKP